MAAAAAAGCSGGGGVGGRRFCTGAFKCAIALDTVPFGFGAFFSFGFGAFFSFGAMAGGPEREQGRTWPGKLNSDAHVKSERFNKIN